MTKYDSKFERSFHVALPALEREPEVLKYEVPASTHRYYPDWRIPGTDIYLETKGIWDVKARAKMLLVQAQHPDKTFIMVFQNPNLPIRKGSKTSVSAWCDKNCLKWMTFEQAVKFVREKSNGFEESKTCI